MHTSIMRYVEDEWKKLGVSYAQFPTVISESLLTKVFCH
jgi:hypothetical protein